MGLMKEFQEFAVKGNVVDMAVGIIIGAAFGKIVSSLVADVITPCVGLLLGGVDFKDLAIVLKQAVTAIPATATQAATPAQPAVLLRYGVFLQTVIDFLIVAASIFVMVKAINKLRALGEKKEEVKS